MKRKSKNRQKTSLRFSPARGGRFRRNADWGGFVGKGFSKKQKKSREEGMKKKKHCRAPSKFEAVVTLRARPTIHDPYKGTIEM